MRSYTLALVFFGLVAAVYSLPAPAAPSAPVEKDALEPQDDLKSSSTYGLGYAYPGLAYPAYSYGYPSYGYGYGLYGYAYPNYGYYSSYGYPAYYL